MGKDIGDDASWGGETHWNIESLPEWHQEIQHKHGDGGVGGEGEEEASAHEEDVG